MSDGWTDIIRNLGQMVPRKGTASDEVRHDMATMMELADFKKMNEVRARVDAVVKDPKTAEALKPWYRQFCKRPTFNDEYLPTFNRPNVKLVDTKGKGVERITEKGLVFDGVEYEVDCIIFATGFEVGTAYTRRAGFEVYGRGGQSLTEYWSEWHENAARFFQPRLPQLLSYGSTAKRDSPRTSRMRSTSRPITLPTSFSMRNNTKRARSSRARSAKPNGSRRFGAERCFISDSRLNARLATTTMRVIQRLARDSRASNTPRCRKNTSR